MLVSCWIQVAAAALSASSPETVDVEVAILAGVDTNAEQSARDDAVAGAATMEVDFDYRRRLGRRTYGGFEGDAEIDLFTGQAEASRATLETALTLGHALVGSPSEAEVRWTRLRVELQAGYGLALRIAGRPEAPDSVWRRVPEGEPPPQLADDDVLDPDVSLSGPAIAFLRPLHDIRVLARLRWRPARTTRIDLGPGLRRVLQGAEPDEPRRHHVQLEGGLGIRQRLARWVQIEGRYRFEHRAHDERRDRADDRLVLSTHRTAAILQLRGGPWRFRFEHEFRFRTASGGGARTRRHVGHIEAQYRVHRRLSVMAGISASDQARLDRPDRDWRRWTAGLGVGLSY